jgi:hypothetical protein
MTLKPCPFCGAPACLREQDAKAQSEGVEQFVSCSLCVYSVFQVEVSSWNKRAINPDVEELVRAARAWLDVDNQAVGASDYFEKSKPIKARLRTILAKFPDEKKEVTG